ncbi:MAG: hypothetical protein KDD60_04705 [Bdellovibrionales bacterium]|nr:hypothetical protein [Bdellovibrionales bacterium]
MNRGENLRISLPSANIQLEGNCFSFQISTIPFRSELFMQLGTNSEPISQFPDSQSSDLQFSDLQFSDSQISIPNQNNPYVELLHPCAQCSLADKSTRCSESIPLEHIAALLHAIGSPAFPLLSSLLTSNSSFSLNSQSARYLSEEISCAEHLLATRQINCLVSVGKNGSLVCTTAASLLQQQRLPVGYAICASGDEESFFLSLSGQALLLQVRALTCEQVADYDLDEFYDCICAQRAPHSVSFELVSITRHEDTWIGLTPSDKEIVLPVFRNSGSENVHTPFAQFYRPDITGIAMRKVDALQSFSGLLATLRSFVERGQLIQFGNGLEVEVTSSFQ